MTLADEAPRLRERIATTFGDLVTISRRDSTSTDTEGNRSLAPTVVGSDVPGRISTPSAQELQIAAQAGQRIDNVFTTAIDTDIAPGDLLTDGTRTWTVQTAVASKVQLKANLVRWTG